MRQRLEQLQQQSEQQLRRTSKAYKIGITQIVTHPALDAAVAGFKEALAEKGFTNVTYDDQNAQGDMANASSIAQKFAGEGLDLILGVATPTTQAVVKADHDHPDRLHRRHRSRRRRPRHRPEGSDRRT